VLVELTSEFEKYPGELKEPDWALVMRVVEQADAEGKSAHYADRVEANGVVAAFYQEEKDEIHKRVGGAVQYQAKEKDCSADLYSPAIHALDKSIEKQLEERTHEDSDAHMLIDQNQTALGKANVEALERQADHVAMASYLGNIGVQRKQRELDRLLQDASGVESTLDDRIEELSKPAPEVKRSAAEQKAIDDELEALKSAKASIQKDVQAAQESQKGAEERAERAQKLYDESLTQLNSLLEQKSEETKGES
jgi:tRNA nucleotidyltransferase (CCA-adding enzyme)